MNKTKTPKKKKKEVPLKIDAKFNDVLKVAVNSNKLLIKKKNK